MLRIPGAGLKVSCPCCGADDAAEWARENGFTAVKCRPCGMVYVNPRPTDEEITQGNIVGEHRTEHGTMQVVYRHSRAKIAHYKDLAAALMPDVLKQELSWLDVGAGFGELLEALRELTPAGSKLDGLEPMQPKVKSAQARGLNVRSADLTDLPSEHYDVVSLINVFSHVPDFDGFLSLIRNALKKNGSLMLVTGNGGDLATRAQYPDLLYLPDHLMFGGVEHIGRILRRNGFEVVKIMTVRRDTLRYCAKSLAKRILGRPATLQLPYRSPFRSVVFRAQRVN